MISYYSDDSIFPIIANLGTTDMLFITGSEELLVEAEDIHKVFTELHEKLLTLMKKCLSREILVIKSYRKYILYKRQRRNEVLVTQMFKKWDRQLTLHHYASCALWRFCDSL